MTIAILKKFPEIHKAWDWANIWVSSLNKPYDIFICELIIIKRFFKKKEKGLAKETQAKHPKIKASELRIQGLIETRRRD